MGTQAQSLDQMVKEETDCFTEAWEQCTADGGTTEYCRAWVEEQCAT